MVAMFACVNSNACADRNKLFILNFFGKGDLKPYVSYRAADTEQVKFTPEHLFYAVYAKKLEKDFKEGKLDEQGNPLEPSEEEKMDADEAWRKARSTGKLFK
ncbi:UNVERIFIED_CONTAM: mRpL41 [Trichonephila clavipes]